MIPFPFLLENDYFSPRSNKRKGEKRLNVLEYINSWAVGNVCGDLSYSASHFYIPALE
jgi:hypothetical protein